MTGMESSFDGVERELKTLKCKDTKIGKFCVLGF